MNSHFNRIDVLDALNVLLKWQTYYTALNRLFFLVKQLYEVDVFEHHRFCDDFPHLINKSLLASRNL